MQVLNDQKLFHSPVEICTGRLLLGDTTGRPGRWPCSVSFEHNTDDQVTTQAQLIWYLFRLKTCCYYLLQGRRGRTIFGWWGGGRRAHTQVLMKKAFFLHLLLLLFFFFFYLCSLIKVNPGEGKCARSFLNRWDRPLFLLQPPYDRPFIFDSFFFSLARNELTTC